MGGGWVVVVGVEGENRDILALVNCWLFHFQESVRRLGRYNSEVICAHFKIAFNFSNLQDLIKY